MAYIVFREVKLEHLDKPIREYYAGYVSEFSPKAFTDSGPIFNRTITRYARFTEAVADLAVKQLTEMGHTVKKEMLVEGRKKRG